MRKVEQLAQKKEAGTICDMIPAFLWLISVFTIG